MHTPKNGSTIDMAPYRTVHDMLVGMQFHLQNKPWQSIGRFTVGGESFGVMYDDDDEGNYAVVASPSLPTDVYAEIDDGTYGEQQGWRFYV